MSDDPNLAIGMILEASDGDAGDSLRIVIVGLLEDGRVAARSIAHRPRNSPWVARLGQTAPWDLTRFRWRPV